MTRSRRTFLESIISALPQHAGLCVIEGKLARDKQALLRLFSDILCFPPSFGYNWDALNDCLNDFEIVKYDRLMIVIFDAALMQEALAEDWQTLVQILTDAVAIWRQFKRELIVSLA